MKRDQHNLLDVIRTLLHHLSGKEIKPVAEVRALTDWLSWRVGDGWESRTANLDSVSCDVSVRRLGVDVVFHVERSLQKAATRE